MKTLRRNQQTIKYALFIEKTEIMKNGYRTGQYQNTYSDPVATKMYVSASKGESNTEMFGTDIQYSRLMITDDINCPIDENSRLWIDKTDGTHDFIVVRKAKSLNSITYAIREVTVSA